MINLTHFRTLIVRPTLRYLDMHSPAAENLVIGTAIAESGLSMLKQAGTGPALGLYQIEPATHKDVWGSWLKYRDDLAEKVNHLAAVEPPLDDQLVSNLRYATAIARLVYYRRPEPLPPPGDVTGLGEYWKQHYNTPLGAGTIEHFVTAYRRHFP